MGESSTLLARPRFMNHRMGEGYLLDFHRMQRWGFFWVKRIWEFRLAPEHPLTFVDRFGDEWQPDRHEEETDLGSEPPPLRSWFPHDEHPLSYLFHDSACRHAGLWWRVVGAPEAAPFVFLPVSRREADYKLRAEWMPTESALSGGRRWVRWPVWVGVRIGAGVRWLCRRG